MLNDDWEKDMKGFTCIEDKCDFKNDCPIIKHFYEKGRADQKKEDNEFFNFEGAYKLEKQKIRADTIEECKNYLDKTFRHYLNEFHYGVTFNWMRDDILKHLEQMQKGIEE